ncbi:MAG: TetR family transcriptional regulator [Propionibacteriales bacterium]|nr:TetR family transcriptional regulator [Propionibacteriales bacterium]
MPESETQQSWRVRQRQATVAEILGAARRLLVEHGQAGISLRAIAREMGMTAPALYRYFGSHEELVAALTVEIYDELIATAERARDAQPEDDPLARLLAVCRAFRRWSIGNREEFGLVFANPIHLDITIERPEGEAHQAAQRFGMLFGGLFVELMHRRGRSPSAEVELDPRITEQFQRRQPILYDVLSPHDLYTFLRAWTLLYGTVALEAFGHCQWALEDAEPMFEDVMRDCATLMGLGDEAAAVLERDS